MLWATLPDDGRIRHAAIIGMIDTIQPLLDSLRPLVEAFDDVVADMLESRRQTIALNMSRRRLANLQARSRSFVLSS